MKIEGEAFAGCSIKTMDLPKSVEAIEKYAFSSCATPVEETSLEMHAEISKTVTVVQINIFSTIHDKYDKIMEW